LLLLTERHVSRLTTDGVLVQSGRGQYDLVGCVQGYVRYLRDLAGGGDTKGGVALAEVKGRMILARTRMAEAEADQLDGTLISRATVETAWGAIVTNLRTRLLAIPNSATPQVQAALSPAEIRAILTNAIHEALAELATTPVYAAADADRLAGPDRHGREGVGDPGAAAEADDFAMG
jgi:phage terminase Nu1 subunit (DNA packaging protein)